MKITIDTTNKTIEIEQDVKILLLINELKKMLPDGQWEDYRIVATVTVPFFQPFMPTIQEPFLIEPYYMGQPTCTSS